MALAGGCTVLLCAAALAYSWPSAPVSGSVPPVGVDAGPLLPVRDSPQHLADQTPTERYFNAVVGVAAGGAAASLAASPGSRNIGIRPDLDEGRQGYVVFAIDGQYRMLSTTAGVSNQSPAGTTQRLEIYGDGRLLASQVVPKGTLYPITDLDVSGVNQLRFVATSAHPPFPAGPEPEAVFADPVLR